MQQTFLIVLKPNVIDDPDYHGDPRWTPESVAESFLNTTDHQQVGIAEVVPNEVTGGWAEAMLEANAQIDNLDLGEDAPPPAAPEPGGDDDTPLDKMIEGLTAIGAMVVTGWAPDGRLDIPHYANSAYAMRGFRFKWSGCKVLGLVGQMVPVVEREGCNHDPSVWGSSPGQVACAKGCGALWQAELAPTPDPHRE